MLLHDIRVYYYSLQSKMIVILYHCYYYIYSIWYDNNVYQKVSNGQNIS